MSRPHPQSTRRMRPWMANAILAAAALAISVVCGEAVLRAFVRLPLRRILPEVRYAPHAVRRFTLLPNQEAFTYGAPVRIDARGFRTNGEPPAAGRPAALALGDSFTFGLGVRDHETWPALLQRALTAATGRAQEVINAGTISYGVFQELDLLRGPGVAARPRIVLHALYWNDFMNASAPVPGAAPVVDANGYFVWDQLAQPRGAVRDMASRVVSSSALLFTLRQAASIAGRNGDSTSYGTAYARFLREGLTADEWQPIEQFYRELQRLGAEHDFGVMAIIMPVSGLMTGPAPQDHPYPAAARALLRRLGISYFDAFPLWAGRSGDDFLPEGADAHLNAGGYRLVVDALARALLEDESLRRRLGP